MTAGRADSPRNDELRIRLPAWVESAVDPGARYASDEDRMRMVVALARANVLHETGGPFAAAVFAFPGSRLVSVGVNCVELLGNSVLHAEILALMLAEAAAGSHSLRLAGESRHELVTSCDPCAMCLGAALWSGVRRIVCAAGRADAERIGFDEGPVFPESYRYLRDRGIEVVHGVLAAEARAVLDLYASRGGPVYNG